MCAMLLYNIILKAFNSNIKQRSTAVVTLNQIKENLEKLRENYLMANLKTTFTYQKSSLLR